MITVSNKLSTWLIRELNDRSWSARELSRRTGVSQTSISSYIEGSLTPSAKTCRKLAAALGADHQEVMRLAGHLPPALPAVKEEEEVLDLLRSLPATTRATVMQMLRSLKPNITYASQPTLAEPPPKYQAAQSIDDQIASIVQAYPDLQPFFEDAQRELPDHAIQALVSNILIWLHLLEKNAFTDFHNRLSNLLTRYSVPRGGSIQGGGVDAIE